MERTLYLTEKKGLLVLRDGPSLWIKEHGKAGTRVPVRLVDMVFIVGNLKMDAGIVALFAEHRVPVTFMSVRGEALAVTIPCGADGETPQQWQQRVLSRPPDRRICESWVYSTRRQVADTVRREMEGRRLPQGFLLDQRSRAPGKWRGVSAFLSGIVRQMATASLIGASLDPDVGILPPQRKLGFADDLCYILKPEIDLQAALFVEKDRESDFLANTPNRCTLSKQGIRRLITLFEERKPVVRENLEAIVRSFINLFADLRS